MARYVSSTLILILLLFSSCAPSRKYLTKKRFQSPITGSVVHVLVYKTNDRLKVQCSKEIRIRSIKTGKELYRASKGNLYIYPEKIKEGVIVESWDSPIRINNTAYRGTIELRNFLGSLHVINVIDLEKYLYSVVPSEIPASWHPEALKAQAVAARTYTLYHLSQRNSKSIFDLDATTNFQVYKGISAENPASTKAVDDTRGLIMTYKSEPIVSYFHSTCGGRTIDDRYVWSGNDLPYLNSVHSNYCSESPHFTWNARLSLYEIQRILKKKYPNVGPIKSISFKKIQGRVIAVKLLHKFGTIQLSGNEFRLLFSPKTVKSTYFNARKAGNSLVLYGRGWGHGVGMCQWSAKKMAEKGFTYSRILSYFYRNIKLTRVKQLLAKNDTTN